MLRGSIFLTRVLCAGVTSTAIPSFAGISGRAESVVTLDSSMKLNLKPSVSPEMASCSKLILK